MQGPETVNGGQQALHSVLIYYVSSVTLSKVLRLCMSQFCIFFHIVNPRENVCFYPQMGRMSQEIESEPL